MRKDNLEEFNYIVIEHCDTCGNKQLGTMMHAHDAMGLATPVLWLCNRCQHPPVLVGIWRECKRRVLRTKLLAKYYLRTSRATRAANRDKIEAIRSRRTA